MKKLALSVSLAIASACGVDQQAASEAADSTVVSAQRQALCTCDRMPPMPATPATATEFATYYRAHDGRLIPPGVASVYIATWQDQKDPNFFVSLAYDVVNQKNIFYLHGTFTSDYSKLTSIVASETAPIPGTNPLSWIDTGTQGQVHTGPPPLPPGGYGALSWNAISVSYQATH